MYRGENVKTTLIVSAESSRDIERETQHTRLNQMGFVRGASDVDQWLLLVNEAWNATRFPFNEIVRDYLVVMLNRFMRRPRLVSDLRAFDYYRYVFGHKPLDSMCIQEIADMSLQYVAFFPERSSYRHEPRTVEHVAEIGVGLYRELSRSSAGKDDWTSGAYREMSRIFGRAVMVLRATHPRFAARHASNDDSESAMLIPTDAKAKEIITAILEVDSMYTESPLSGKKNVQ